MLHSAPAHAATGARGGLAQRIGPLALCRGSAVLPHLLGHLGLRQPRRCRQHAIVPSRILHQRQVGQGERGGGVPFIGRDLRQQQLRVGQVVLSSSIPQTGAGWLAPAPGPRQLPRFPQRIGQIECITKAWQPARLGLLRRPARRRAPARASPAATSSMSSAMMPMCAQDCSGSAVGSAAMLSCSQAMAWASRPSRRRSVPCCAGDPCSDSVVQLGGAVPAPLRGRPDWPRSRRAPGGSRRDR